MGGEKKLITALQADEDGVIDGRQGKRRRRECTMKYMTEPKLGTQPA